MKTNYLLCLMAITLTAMNSQITSANAATLIVANTNDSGPGSLRQVIADAAPGDTIALSFKGTVNVIYLNSGELLIDKNLTIVGPGAGKLWLWHGNSSGGSVPPARVFNVSQLATVTISDLTIARGLLDATLGQAFTQGGGVLNSGDLTLRHCTILYNGIDSFVYDGVTAGGGIYNSGTLTLIESTIGPNSSAEYGGGLYNDTNGTATVVGCTFVNNATSTFAPASSGGGIFNAGVVTISNSTFTKNYTWAGNGAGVAEAGAIFNSGTATISASTIAGNGAEEGVVLVESVGSTCGGVVNVGSCTISNSIIAGNIVDGRVGLVADAPDCSGLFISQGFNLIGNSDGSGGFVNGINADQVGNRLAPLDPKLDKLKNNGGPTKTMALLPGSPAIDQGNSFGLTTDQRGFVRPDDLPAVPNASGGDGSDIGAFELHLTPISVASRKAHGSAGTFDVNLPLTGNPGHECRSGGPSGDYTLVFTFANTLTNVDSATVTAHDPASGTGTVSGNPIVGPDATLGLTASQCAVNLTNVSNAQYITVSLTNVSDSVGDFSPAVAGQMGVLLGDVNASGRVDAADVSLVRQQTLQQVTPDNFREDINASGRIDAADVSIARQQTLTSLP